MVGSVERLGGGAELSEFDDLPGEVVAEREVSATENPSGVRIEKKISTTVYFSDARMLSEPILGLLGRTPSSSRLLEQLGRLCWYSSRSSISPKRRPRSAIGSCGRSCSRRPANAAILVH